MQTTRLKVLSLGISILLNPALAEDSGSTISQQVVRNVAITLPEKYLEVTQTEQEDQQYIFNNHPTIDTLVLEAMRVQKIQGCSVGIVKNGELVGLKAYGKRDLKNIASTTDDLPFDLGTMSQEGSVTKVFTAVMIWQAIEEGKLTLNTKLTTAPGDGTALLSNMSTLGRTITVRQALAHLSGLKTTAATFIPWGDWSTQSSMNAAFPGVTNPAQIMANAVRTFNKTTSLIPSTTSGYQYSYSNLGYTLLGAALEKVYPGKTYEELLKERVGDRIGLKTLHLCHPWRTTVYKKSKGYELDASGNVIASPNEAYNGWHAAAGASCMTIGDLARFAQALENNTLISSSSKNQMTTRQRLDTATGVGNGTLTTMGLGLMYKSESSPVGATWLHSGDIDGYTARIVESASANVSVVMSCNHQGADLRFVPRDIIKYVVESWDPVQ